MEADRIGATPRDTVRPGQLRAARAMLDWTLVETSRRARVSIAALTSTERETRPVADDVRGRLITAYEAAGIVFQTADGVALSPAPGDPGDAPGALTGGQPTTDGVDRVDGRPVAAPGRD